MLRAQGKVDARGVGVPPGIGHHEAQVGGEEVVLGLLAQPHLLLELDLLDLAFKAALLKASLGALAGLDLLG